MVAQFLVPLIFTIVALVVARTLPSQRDTHQVSLALGRYGATKVPVALEPLNGPLASVLANMYGLQLPAQQGQLVNVTGEQNNNNKKKGAGSFLDCLSEHFSTASLFFFSSFSSDFTDYILKKAREEGGNFNEHCVVGASFRGSSDKFAEVTAYFNNEGYHTPATALMMADNALYKLLAGPNASIETSNYPMPRNITETALGQLTESVRGCSNTLAFHSL